MKTSSFKKVLALVLALAMVFSVCTMNFTASAETADLSYYVMNDATADNGWENGSSVAPRVYGDRTVYRIAPQSAITSQIGFKNDLGSLTADDLATVNTLSFYIKNETGVELGYTYKYFTEYYSGEGENRQWLGADNALFKNGYAYLVGTDEAEIIPVKLDGTGKLTIPAKFEGYVIYDLSKSDNYGMASLSTKEKDEEGKIIYDQTKTVVDVIKASFPSMNMYVGNTEKMFTKAWYVDDIAISTKTVEELAKFLTNSEFVSYNFNMATLSQLNGNDNIVMWGNRFADCSEDDNSARGNLVDFADGLDGVGRKFTLVTAAGQSIGGVSIRDSFIASRGTDLPFALDKAVGFKYDVEVEGTLPMSFNIAGQSNGIRADAYYVYEDGTVIYNDNLPADFKGTVYYIFKDKAVKGTTSWADFINVNLKDSNNFDFTLYNSDALGAVANSTITYGNFAFIYDAEPIVAAYKAPETNNPVIFDGNEKPMRWSGDGNQPAAYHDNWTITVGKELTAVYKGTSTSNWFYFNRGGKKYDGTLDAANVKGFSFKLKTPADAASNLQVGMGGDNSRRFTGTLYAINNNGKVVATVAGDPTKQTQITLPAGFDGIIVMDAAGDSTFTTNYSTGQTDFVSFYNAGKFNGVHLMLGYKGTLVVGETTYVYDDLTVIYDELNAYMDAYKATCTPEKEAVLFDGTKVPMRWVEGDQAWSTRKDWRLSTVDGEIQAVYVATTTESLPNNIYFNNSGVDKALDGVDIDRIDGFSFKFKVPEDGNAHTLRMFLEYANENAYLGVMKAIDKKGNVVASTKGAWNGSSLKLPAYFDGYIVMVDNARTDGSWNKGYVGTESSVQYATFAEYYEARGNKWKGLSMMMSTEGEYELEVSTYVYDEFKAIYDDVDAYIADLQAKLQAEYKVISEEEAHNDGYIVNNLSGVDGNTAGIYTDNKNNNVDVNYGFNFSDDFSCAYITFNPYHPAGGQRDHSMAINNKAGLDLSNIAGISYRVDVTNPHEVKYSWSYQVNEQQNSMVDTIIYAISDDNEITKYNSIVTLKKEFHGKIVVLFNTEGTAVKATWGSTKGEHTWKDFVNKFGFKNIRMWFGGTDTFPMEEVEETNEAGETVKVNKLTGPYTEFAMEYDDLAVLYADSPIMETLKYYANTEDAFNGGYSLTNVGNAPFAKYGLYETSVVDLEEAPNGYAVFFDRVKDKYTVEETNDAGETVTVEKTPTSTTHAIKLDNAKLTQEKLAAMEGVSFWVKVPEGTTKTFQPEFNSDGNYYKGVYITVDQNTGEVKYFDYNEKGASISLPGGFTGYVILPLKYAAFTKGWSHDPAKFTDYPTLASSSKLNQFVFYWANTHTDWYMGEIKMIDKLDDYMAELGIEQVSGDINGDMESDLRDLVRMKKFNADNRTTVAYQNLDIDKNGIVETATELIASRKQLLDVDYIAPEKDASLVEYPDTFVGIYHSGYGSWDSLYGDVIAEDKIVNMYSSNDLYTLAQLKEKGGNTWFYLSESLGSEPVFGSKADGYDREATEINEAYKTALDNSVNKLKKLGLWNVVLGFTDEEILIGDQKEGMTQAQFAIWTKYLVETYGKRFNACLSTYEVNGNEKNGTSAANAETYAYVTDIGYDWYTGTLEQHQAMLKALQDNIGNRTDVKYWFYPTAYSPMKDNAPAWTDAYIAEQIGIFDTMFESVPAAQRGGLYFYTWKDWSSSYGIESLIDDYGYTATRDALIAVASKWAK